MAHPKIEIKWNTVVKSFTSKIQEGSEKTFYRKSRLKGSIAMELKLVKVLSVLVHLLRLGHDPNTKFLKGHLDMTSDGYLLTDKASTKTSIDGIFAAGDVADPRIPPSSNECG